MNNTSINNKMTSCPCNTMSVENALVEEVCHDSRTSGHILISYPIKDECGKSKRTLLRLNVTRNTKIISHCGKPLFLCDIKKGMCIDACFSSSMTRSIPPQSNAFEITVLKKKDEINITTGCVLNVDIRRGFLLTGTPHRPSQQMRFILTDTTIIRDKCGKSIRLCSLRPGQMVRVEHASFQTASIPPQTTAFCIQIV